MGPTLPPTNLDVLLLMGRVPGSSGVAASRYEFIFRSSGGSSLILVRAENRFSDRGKAVRYFLSLVGDVALNASPILALQAALISSTIPEE